MRAALVTLICLSLSGVGVVAQQDWQAPAGVSWRTDTILSEGTRLAAEIFSPSDGDGEKLPCILMAHGWGGTARGLRRDAVAFAKAGYLAVTFDYRGWGRLRNGGTDRFMTPSGVAPKLNAVSELVETCNSDGATAIPASSLPTPLRMARQASSKPR